MSSTSLFDRLVKWFQTIGEESSADADETGKLDVDDECGEHSFRLDVRAREGNITKQRVVCRDCPETRWQ